jgi:predicted pyridoxine 5'-phosphate oxidase superfamily flavin-nucleotide-binding protein
MTAPTSDMAFTASVKAAQAPHGSREAYARLEARGGFPTGVTDEVEAVMARVDTAYLATATAAGQPYVQHGGGPPGFIRKLGPDVLGFADYVGNRQYVTTGNLAEDDRAFLSLMDYARGQRVKLWGHAAMTGDTGLIGRLMPTDYHAGPGQAVLFTITAWDMNCSQHIPRKVNVTDVAAVLALRDDRTTQLEAELSHLKSRRQS